FGSLDEQNTLPVNIVSFKASKLGNTTKLDWKINRDHDVLKFEILTSDNNRDFKNIGQVNAASGVFSYDFSDNDSRKGAAYYRLKITTKGGKVMYSKVVVVFHENNGQRLITLAPTVTSNYSNLVINSANAGRISVGVSNMLGQVFQSQTVMLKPGENFQRIDLSGMKAGQYIITVIDEKGQKASYRVIRN
ncbi:MAG: T9SS type A sorting domain-containing protein, partial [Flavitalea sp.]